MRNVGISRGASLFRSLDHLVLMTRDLPSASSDYSKVFGCEPVWRGVHDGLGTENAIFSVNNTYLEILAPRAKGAGADFVNSVIDADGEGLAGLALETSDIGRLKKELSERKVPTKKIVSGAGLDSQQDKSRTWQNLFFSRDLTRGLFIFAIQHESEKLQKSEVSRSTIDRLDHVVVHTNDPDGFVSLYRDKFGIKLSLDQTVEKWGGRMLFFRLNRTTIEVIGKIEKDGIPKDSFWGLAWSVSDLKAVHRRLTDVGVEVSNIRDGRKPRTIVCTVKSHTRGVPTLLIEHLDR